MPADVWMDDLTQWPPLSYPDLYHYLIKTSDVYAKEKMENYKVLQAHKYFFVELLQLLTQQLFDIFTIFPKLNKQCKMLFLS